MTSTNNAVKPIAGRSRTRGAYLNLGSAIPHAFGLFVCLLLSTSCVAAAAENAHKKSPVMAPRPKAMAPAYKSAKSIVSFSDETSMKGGGAAGGSPLALDPNSRVANIVGGQEDRANKFPYIVIVDDKCSGSLVAPSRVVTAAHCLCDKREVSPQKEGVFWRLDHAQCDISSVVTFVYFVPNSKRGGAKLRKMTKDIDGNVAIHPGFFMELDSQLSIVRSRADVAYVDLLESPTATSNVLQPVSISDTPVKAGERITLVGYGYNSEGGGFGIRRFGSNVVAETNEEFVLVNNVGGGSLTWRGDSGGAALVGETAFGLIGIVSYGAFGKQSGFTNANTYRAWLLADRITASGVDISKTTAEPRDAASGDIATTSTVGVTPIVPVSPGVLDGGAKQ